ncbi:MAG: type II toxin-antitoxin system VapC family toxin [Pararhizobium sp.]|nr:type II toxin-antitoxin system VapC family toxin [Pararhizobium sp.]
MSERLLLDTCAIVWIANRHAISRAAMDAIEALSANGGALCVSVMSAWEIGMLVSRGRLPSTRDALSWFNEFVTAGGIVVYPATPAVLIGAAYLPEPLHRDPMDRILIATAREHDLTIVTRDRAILNYGAAGHVRTLAC